MQAVRRQELEPYGAEAAGPALSVRDLRVTYGAEGSGGRTVLDGVTFEVRDGEFLCVVGGSGTGKTTLLRALAGLVRPAGGALSFRSQPITGPSRDRAIIFQDYSKALLPWRTVRGNIALSLETRGIRPDEREATIDDLVGKMGLRHAQHQFPGQLSGGMQQRVQIARCLAQEPKILLMDEPFGALDAMTRQTLQDEILQLAADKKMTVVFITHDLEEAIYLGDSVVVLGGAPATVIETVDVGLPRPRNQLTTREDARFLAHRHRLFQLLAHHQSGSLGLASRPAAAKR
ncbi:MAG TPA: ABC transporter ATP-binding protein [Pseudolabrys sp.]|nr:ABC transporter ATP-binding protein [Pseudolabrys sp.]